MGFLRDEQGRLIRKDGSLVPRGTRHKGPRRTVIEGGGAEGAGGTASRVSHMRVDVILGGSGPLRDEYERMLENPATLIKDLQAWFAARGHRLNKTAIGRHRKTYLAQWNDIRTAAKTSAAFADIVHRDGRGGG